MEMKKSVTTMPIPSVFLGPRKYGALRSMTAVDFAGVYAEVFTVVKDAFSKQGQFAATAFIVQVNDDGKIGLAYPAALARLMFEHEHGKELARGYLDHMLSLQTVDLIVLTTESWRAPFASLEDPVPASLHPDRQEILMFNIMGKDCQALAACPLERDAQDVATIPWRTALGFVHEEHNRAEGVFIRKRATALN